MFIAVFLKRLQLEKNGPTKGTEKQTIVYPRDICHQNDIYKEDTIIY